MDKIILFNKCNSISKVDILKFKILEILKCNYSIQFSKHYFHSL